MTDKPSASAASALDDDELSVPRASVNKMIRELAPNLRISNETRELIINCCNEFIHLLASEANEVCNKQQKKTIAPEHVLTALENLGFESYLADVRDCVDEAKEVALKKRRQSTKLENLGIPEEELLRQQQELFAKAREEQAALEQQEWENLQQQAFYQQQQAAAAAGQAPMYYTPHQPAATATLQSTRVPRSAGVVHTHGHLDSRITVLQSDDHLAMPVAMDTKKAEEDDDDDY